MLVLNPFHSLSELKQCDIFQVFVSPLPACSSLWAFFGCVGFLVYYKSTCTHCSRLDANSRNHKSSLCTLRKINKICKKAKREWGICKGDAFSGDVNVVVPCFNVVVYLACWRFNKQSPSLWLQGTSSSQVMCLLHDSRLRYRAPPHLA